MRIIKILCILLFCIPTLSAGQENAAPLNVFNLGIDNGLPHNHVHGITIDQYGYLWMGTEKGVVKYNGYDCRIFTPSDGLPVEPNWQVFNDRKGRIWLGNLSPQMGYIYHDVYHKAYFDFPNRVIYPKDLADGGNGLLFYTTLTNGVRQVLCRERNDSIFMSQAPEDVFPKPTAQGDEERERTITTVARDGRVIVFYRNNIFEMSHGVKRLCTLEQPLLTDVYVNGQPFVISHFFVAMNPPSRDRFWLIDFNTGKQTEVPLERFGITGEEINHRFIDRSWNGKDEFYIFTNKHILKLELKDTLVLLQKYNIPDVLPPEVEPGSINTMVTDPLWGTLLCTNANGLFIRYSGEDPFQTMKGNALSNYEWVGGSQDSVLFFWNKAKHTVTALTRNQIINWDIPIVATVRQVEHIGHDTFRARCINVDYSLQFVLHTQSVTRVAVSPVDAAQTISDGKYTFGVSIGQFFRIKNGDTGSREELIDQDRYTGLQYDRLRHQFWAYNNFKVCTYGPNREKRMYAKDSLSQLGVQSISKVLIDSTYGNIFLLGYDKLVHYNPDSKKATPLFEDIYLKDAKLLFYHDLLIAAGRFGILFSRISGNGKLSEPYVIHNHKNTHYKYVLDVQASWNKIFLVTDRGSYEVSIPDAVTSGTGKVFQDIAAARFLVYHENEITDIDTKDTLYLNQKNLTLRFDIINPYGNGPLRYAYRAGNDSLWHDLNTSELNLASSLRPGEYVAIWLSAHDNVWKSGPRKVYVYVTPYWWQTVIYSRLFWPGVLLLLLLAVGSIIFLTRKMVMRANQKRNMRRDIELKSVYAQINPHFIFNTLSTIMYFIKKKELGAAYDHVDKFSLLLRAYIKSARNKYISLSAEIATLHNYIQLQQARFEDKFDYEITTEPDIDAERLKIPALLLQPVVENAIDHGIFHIEGRGCLKIMFRKTPSKNELVCIVDDNGIGRKKAQELSQGSIVKKESYGSALIADLVTIFNKYEKIRISVDYIDKLPPETGTTVTITIKYLPDEK